MKLKKNEDDLNLIQALLKEESTLETPDLYQGNFVLAIDLQNKAIQKNSKTVVHIISNLSTQLHQLTFQIGNVAYIANLS